MTKTVNGSAIFVVCCFVCLFVVSVCGLVSVCVPVRARARVCVCVCVYVRVLDKLINQLINEERL